MAAARKLDELLILLPRDGDPERVVSERNKIA